MFDRRHDLTVGGVITTEFVGKEPARFPTLTFDQTAKEADSGFFIASSLHENIDGIAILIDRTPEIVLGALNGDNGFIQMPGITQATLSLFLSSRIGRAKFQAPPPYRFVGHDDAPFSEEFFDFTEAQTETMIQPNSVADNLGWETKALVANGFGLHAEQSAKCELN